MRLVHVSCTMVMKRPLDSVCIDIIIFLYTICYKSSVFFYNSKLDLSSVSGDFIDTIVHLLSFVSITLIVKCYVTDLLF